MEQNGCQSIRILSTWSRTATITVCWQVLYSLKKLVYIEFASLSSINWNGLRIGKVYIDNSRIKSIYELLSQSKN